MPARRRGLVFAGIQAPNFIAKAQDLAGGVLAIALAKDSHQLEDSPLQLDDTR
jgi:hypothetical protein